MYLAHNVRAVQLFERFSSRGTGEIDGRNLEKIPRAPAGGYFAWPRTAPLVFNEMLPESIMQIFCLPGNPLAEYPVRPTLVKQHDGHKDQRHDGHDLQRQRAGTGILHRQVPFRLEA